MNLRDDLLPILQQVSSVRLGDSLYPHADQIIDLFTKALFSAEVHQAMADTIAVGTSGKVNSVDLADDVLIAIEDKMLAEQEIA